VGSQTGSSIPKPINQRYSMLYSISSINSLEKRDLSSNPFSVSLPSD
jgi:hypothetical protein